MAQSNTVSTSRVVAQASTLAEVVAKNLLLEKEVSRLRHNVSVLSQRELTAKKRLAEVESLLEESMEARELAEKKREEEVVEAEGRVAEATMDVKGREAWAGWLATREVESAANAAIREATEAANAVIEKAEEKLAVALSERGVAEAKALEWEEKAKRAKRLLGETVERLEGWIGAWELPSGKRGPPSRSAGSSSAGSEVAGEEGCLVGVPVARGKVVVVESPASRGGRRKGKKKER